MSSFAIGISVFKEFNKIQDFSMVLLFSEVPGIFISVFAGNIADRHSKIKIIKISYFLSLIICFGFLVLSVSGSLDLKICYLLLALGSLVRAFEMSAFNALIPDLVPESNLERAFGKIQTLEYGSMVVAPLLAATLYSMISLSGIFALECFGLFVSLCLVVFFVKVKSTEAVSNQFKMSVKSEISDILEAVRFVKKSAFLLKLLFLTLVLNFASSLVMALMTPLFLTSSGEKTLSFANSFCAGGLILGALIAPYVKEKYLNHAQILYFGGIFGAVGLIFASLFRSVASEIFGISLVYLSSAAMSISLQTLWTKFTPNEMRGRVYSLRRVVVWSCVPIAYLNANSMVNFFHSILEIHNTRAINADFFVFENTQEGAIKAVFLFLAMARFLATVFISPKQSLAN